MPLPTLRLEIRDRVAHLTLTRPQAANTMDLQFGREFAAAAQVIAGRPPRARGVADAEGKNFCFGGDLRAMVAAGNDVQLI